MERHVNALQGDCRLSAFEGDRQCQRPGLANEVPRQRVELARCIRRVNDFLHVLGAVGSLRDAIDELPEYVKIGSLLEVSIMSRGLWKCHTVPAHTYCSPSKL